MASVLEPDRVAVIPTSGCGVSEDDAVGLAILVGGAVRVGSGVEVADGSGVEVDVAEGLAFSVTVMDPPDPRQAFGPQTGRASRPRPT